MIGSMESLSPYSGGSALSRWWNSRTFIQKRLIRFCLSMLVMILCFPLYYMGLFVSVDGPLNPLRIGEFLAGMGVTKTHSAVFFISFLVIGVSWNWIYNLASLLTGSRLTCKRADEQGRLCGVRAVRRKVVHRKTGKVVAQYVCINGHKEPEAHFHPVRKGTLSHTIWVIALIFCIVVLFLS